MLLRVRARGQVVDLAPFVLSWAVGFVQTASARRDRTVAVERYAWSGAVALAVSLSLAKGLRFPNAWAATAVQVDCSLGFIKRCAMGQAFDWLHLPTHYAGFAAVSTVLLIATLIALGAYLRPLASSKEGLASLIAIGASFALAYYVNLIGYADIPLTLFAVAAISAPGKWRPVAIAVAAVAGILFHELYLIVFLPVTLLALLVLPRPRWRVAVAIAGLALCVALAMALRAPATPGMLAELRAHATATADFSPYQMYFDIFGRSIADNLTLLQTLIGQPWWTRLAIGGAVMVAPVIPVAVWLLLRAWPSAPIVLRWLGGAACCSPLAMNLLGWDAARWDALVVLDFALVLAVFARHYGPPVLPERHAFLAVAICSAVLGGVTVAPLIDRSPPPLFWPV
jgi:hypothetical protein